MKNSIYYLGALLAVGTAFTACSNDELLQKVPGGQQSFHDGRISFAQRTGNMTRAGGDNQAQKKGHYEFGVYGVLGEIADQGTTNTVMKNYLVAYGKNALYKDIYAANASTSGENAGDNYTDAADGLSTWFYEGIGKGTEGEGYTWAHTTYTTPDNDQILKYWTKGIEHHFFAYMPYAAADKAAYTSDQLVLKNLHSFYTYPVVQGSDKLQPTNAVVAAANALSAQYNDEMLNYNEALYAYNHQNGNSTKDVTLDFKHINSKIQIAFYEVIKGYSVEIIDVRPANAVTKSDDTKKLYAGIAFSTATKAQANLPMTVTQPALGALPQYDREGTATVSAMSTSPAVAMSDQAKDKANLRFQKPTGTIATTSTAATLSPTTYYAMPQTPSETGLTLHISYRLTPVDGSSPITIYDARCYVAPEYLKWEPGKAYKYIFKITDKTNGVTNPNQTDPAITDPTNPEPWVDPEDPRVPDEPALKPIVFDGVTITDYEHKETGKTDDTDEWIISNTSLVNAIDWLKATDGGNYTFNSSVNYSDYNVTLECAAANIASPNLYIWNDLSRVLGALYKYKGSDVWVEHIIFNEVQYDWQTTGTTFAGSNWTKHGETYNESDKATTDQYRLLRKVTDALNESASNVSDVDNGNGTHKVTNRISMNLQFKNGTTVPFTVTVIIPDYPNP